VRDVDGQREQACERSRERGGGGGGEGGGGREGERDHVGTKARKRPQKNARKRTPGEPGNRDVCSKHVPGGTCLLRGTCLTEGTCHVLEADVLGLRV
jgi:hypothetical protein